MVKDELTEANVGFPASRHDTRSPDKTDGYGADRNGENPKNRWSLARQSHLPVSTTSYSQRWSSKDRRALKRPVDLVLPLFDTAADKRAYRVPSMAIFLLYSTESDKHGKPNVICNAALHCQQLGRETAWKAPSLTSCAEIPLPVPTRPETA